MEYITGGICPRCGEPFQIPVEPDDLAGALLSAETVMRDHVATKHPEDVEVFEEAMLRAKKTPLN